MKLCKFCCCVGFLQLVCRHTHPTFSRVTFLFVLFVVDIWGSWLFVENAMQIFVVSLDKIIHVVIQALLFSLSLSLSLTHTHTYTHTHTHTQLDVLVDNIGRSIIWSMLYDVCMAYTCTCMNDLHVYAFLTHAYMHACMYAWLICVCTGYVWLLHTYVCIASL